MKTGVGGPSFATPSSVLPSLRELSHWAAGKAVQRLLVGFNQNATVHQHAPNKTMEQFCLVDATLGNGYDSLFMLRLLEDCGAGPELAVRAFDVQPTALESAQNRLRQAAEESPRLEARLRAWQGYLLDHADFADEAKGLERLLPCPKIGLAMFNLGFLPGSDKSVITRPESTLTALKGICERILPSGLISLHCYAGHSGGAEETAKVAEFCAALPSKTWKVCLTEFTNRHRNREVLILVEALI